MLLTTKTGAEGRFKECASSSLLAEPFWNPVKINQVKRAAVRVASHIELPPKERTVEIFTYLSKIGKKQLKSVRIIK